MALSTTACLVQSGVTSPLVLLAEMSWGVARRRFAMLVAFLVMPCRGQAQTSIWTAEMVPPSQERANDNAAVTLGLKFQSEVPGFVSAVRFFKAAESPGPFMGNLWSGTGTKLATVTFADTSAAGWQQANL